MATEKLKNKETGQLISPANSFTKNEMLKTGKYEVYVKNTKTSNKTDKTESASN